MERSGYLPKILALVVAEVCLKEQNSLETNLDVI